MKSKFFRVILLCIALIIIQVIGVMAEDRIYQKVTRKKVNIVTEQESPDQEESSTYSTDYQKDYVPVEDVVPVNPPVPSLYDVVDDSAPVYEEDMLKDDYMINPFQLGLKIGATAPGFGGAVEAGLFPVPMSETSALFTHIAIGMASDKDYNVLFLYLNEVIKFNIFNTTRYYLGGGINLPIMVSTDLSKDAGLGLNAVAGIEFDANLFKERSEALYLEAGYNSFNSNDGAIGILNLLGGYKIFF